MKTQILIAAALAGLALAMPAKAADNASAPPTAAEMQTRYIAMDDCLAKSVAKQAQGRPIEPLLTDIWGDCKFYIMAAISGLKANGETEKNALDKVYALHIVPIVARANPM